MIFIRDVVSVNRTVLKSHFCSNFFLLARKKSDFCWFFVRLRQPSYGTQRTEFNSSSRRVGSSSPRATPQVGSVASSVEGRQTPATTCARNDPHSRAVGASRISMVRRPVHPLQRSSPVAHQRWVVADAVADVQRLEAAIAVLGGDNVHAKGLQEALASRKIQNQSASNLRASGKRARQSSKGPRNGSSERRN